MKPARFAYHRPAGLAELLDALARHGEEARILAGGQSLMPMLNMRLARPAVLLDVNRIAELGGVRLEADTIVLGALTRHRTLETDPLIAREVPLLARAAAHIAHPAVRNRGTIGGSLALADPAAELPACVLCLDGHLHLASRRGMRRLAAHDFFTGIMTTAAAPDEAVVAVELPRARPQERFAIAEFARRHGDYALAGIAAKAIRRGDRLTLLRLSIFGVADRPVLASRTARRVEEAGGVPAVEALRDWLAGEIEPVGDAVHPAALRLHFAAVLAQRVLAELLA
jgi:carbon-monoxide dehydrogenase medium subunit